MFWSFSGMYDTAFTKSSLEYVHAWCYLKRALGEVLQASIGHLD